LTAELDQLRAENRRLTKRLQLVEDSRGSVVGDLSARVDSELHTSSGKEVEGILALTATNTTYTVSQKIGRLMVYHILGK